MKNLKQALKKVPGKTMKIGCVNIEFLKMQLKIIKD